MSLWLPPQADKTKDDMNEMRTNSLLLFNGTLPSALPGTHQNPTK